MHENQGYFSFLFLQRGSDCTSRTVSTLTARKVLPVFERNHIVILADSWTDQIVPVSSYARGTPCPVLVLGTTCPVLVMTSRALPFRSSERWIACLPSQGRIQRCGTRS